MQRQSLEQFKHENEPLSGDEILPAEMWYKACQPLPCSDWQNVSKASRFLRSIGLTIYSDHGGTPSDYQKSPILSSTSVECGHNQSVSDIFRCNKTTIGVVVSSIDSGRNYAAHTAKILFYKINPSATSDENPYTFSHSIHLTDEPRRVLSLRNVVKYSEEIFACIANDNKILFWNWRTGERDAALEKQVNYIENASHLAITPNKTLVCATFRQAYSSDITKAAHFINLEKNQHKTVQIPCLNLNPGDAILTWDGGVIFEESMDNHNSLSLFDEEGHLLSQHAYHHSLKLACILPSNQLASLAYPFIRIHDLITGELVKEINCLDKHRGELSYPVFSYIGSGHIMMSVVNKDKENFQLWNYKQGKLVQEIPMERQYNLRYPLCFSMKEQGLVMLYRGKAELTNLDFSQSKVALQNTPSMEAIESDKTAGYQY